MQIRNQQIHEKVITNFTPLAIIALGIFAVSSFFLTHEPIMGFLQLFHMLLLLFLFPYLKKKSLYTPTGNLLALIGLVTIMPWLITGGYGNEGFLWSVVYIVGVYFVNKKRHAYFWIAIYLLIAFVIVVLSELGYFKIAYELPELLNLLIMYIFTFAFINQYNYVREYYLKLWVEKEKELYQKNEELIAANTELAQFAYVASHDLKEPLLTISSFVHVLQEKHAKKGDEESDTYFEFVSSAVKRMQLLITDLLSLSRIGNHKEMESFTQVNCNKLMEHLLQDVHAMITEHHAVIKFTNLPIITGNEIALTHLFQNIISNAIKFKKEDQTPQIEIKASEDDLYYTFSISDNGIGIEDKYFDKIFTIFQRLNSAEEYPGSGIGLSICKKVVALHKGKIWVRSKLHVGSTFYFTIAK
ncbi:MAG TPA: ATP-binding protein [Bacteroidia bacterium]|nr:ATP-binding protein [Bacteroidia bacterium]